MKILPGLKDKKIVISSGVFDILHVGHLMFLKQAKKLGDILIIGLVADYYITESKGVKRPVNNVLERAEMLDALRPVDIVVVAEEESHIGTWLVSELHPQFFAYSAFKSNEVEKKLRNSSSITEFVCLPEVNKGRLSTTAILKRGSS